MAENPCLDSLRESFKDMSDRELAAVMREAKRRRDLITADANIANADAAVAKAAAEGVEQAKIEALLVKRNALFNLKSKESMKAYLKENWADGLQKGIEAMLFGSEIGRKGARNSVAAAQLEMSAKYTGGLLSDLDRIDPALASIFASGKMDQQISMALYDIDLAPDRLATYDHRVVKIAQTIAKWQEVARRQANQYGANIGKMPGYIARQSHNMDTIRKAGKDAWRAFVLERLDVERTFGADANKAGEILDGLWSQFASGHHLSASGGAFSLPGMGNLGKKISKERVLHFKDGKAFADYQKSFGHPSLSHAIFRGLESSAQVAGMMRKMGPNAHLNLATIVKELADDLVRSGDVAQAEALRNGQHRIDTAFKVLDGSVNIPGNAMLSRWGSAVRKIVSMSKLGGAAVSSIADVFMRGAEAKFQGRSYLSEYGRAIKDFTKLFGKDAEKRNRIAQAMGITYDDMLASRFSPLSADDGAPGLLSAMQEKFFRYSGLSGLTHNQRTSFVLGMANDLAQQRGMAFGELSKETRNLLEVSNIGEPEWNVIRAAVDASEDGMEFLAPERIAAMTDNQVRAYIGATGRELPDAESAARNLIRDERDKLESLLRGMYIDRSNVAVLEPGARTKAFMTQGTRPGTFLGEMVRSAMQFKSYSVGVIQEAIGRELRGSSKELTLRGALKDQSNPWARNLSLFMVNSIAMGYVAMSLKDISKNRTPRDPTDPKTFLASAVQGGGIGIYGDFLFGEANRFGGGFGATLAGPIIGGLSTDIHSLYVRFRDGDDVAASAIRTIYNNLPFANLFYTRAAVDALIMNHVYDAINPGSVDRARKAAEKRSGQTQLFQVR